ncbi:hypothetical protein AX15_007259 [Amanita polypyramis BW_CC]|nr:hypothetical protein AX15_007259 [Amanita polypyramis BW_CC]
MRSIRLHRVATLIVAFSGAILNLLAAVQLFTLWHSFRWETESEWDWLGDKWRADGIKVVWFLLCGYCTSAAIISAVGLAGAIKNKARLVRFYRDYYIADFSFCTSFSIVTVYAAFHTTARAGICEEFSRHPELMRDMQEMGMNIENCELWLSRAALAIVAVLFTLFVIRLHFLLAVSNYYTTLARFCRNCCEAPPPHSRSHSRSESKRIYLLPAPEDNSLADSDGVELVYAPVPMSRLSQGVRSQAMEAWVSETMPVDQQHSQTRKHHHSRRHSRTNSACKDNRAGTIFLPIQPGECLLPTYSTQQGYVKA